MALHQDTHIVDQFAWMHSVNRRQLEMLVAGLFQSAGAGHARPLRTETPASCRSLNLGDAGGLDAEPFQIVFQGVQPEVVACLRCTG